MSRQFRPDVGPHPTSSSHCSDKAKLGVSYRDRGKPWSRHWTCGTLLFLILAGDTNSQVLAQNQSSGVERDSIALLP